MLAKDCHRAPAPVFLPLLFSMNTESYCFQAHLPAIAYVSPAALVSSPSGVVKAECLQTMGRDGLSPALCPMRHTHTLAVFTEMGGSEGERREEKMGLL